MKRPSLHTDLLCSPLFRFFLGLCTLLHYWIRLAYRTYKLFSPFLLSVCIISTSLFILMNTNLFYQYGSTYSLYFLRQVLNVFLEVLTLIFSLICSPFWYCFLTIYVQVSVWFIFSISICPSCYLNQAKVFYCFIVIIIVVFQFTLREYYLYSCKLVGNIHIIIILSVFVDT